MDSGKGRISPMHVSGTVVVNSNWRINADDILLDSGAISASYMSIAFYNKHIDVLRNATTYVTKSVRLGDSQTVKPISMIVDIKLLLVEKNLEYDTKTLC